MGNIERRIQRLEEALPEPVTDFDNLPVEQWVAEILRDGGPALYGHEEDFYGWLEALGDILVWPLTREFAAATGQTVTLFDAPELPEEVIARVAACLPEHIEARRIRFVEAQPSREKKARAREEFEATHRPDPRAQGWRAGAEQERRRLAREYKDWPEEWASFYEEWKEHHGR